MLFMKVEMFSTQKCPMPLSYSNFDFFCGFTGMIQQVRESSPLFVTPCAYILIRFPKEKYRSCRNLNYNYVYYNLANNSYYTLRKTVFAGYTVCHSVLPSTFKGLAL